MAVLLRRRRSALSPRPAFRDASAPGVAAPYTTNSTNVTFYLNTTRSNFTYAENMCMRNGGHLAAFTSVVEQVRSVAPLQDAGSRLLEEIVSHEVVPHDGQLLASTAALRVLALIPTSLGRAAGGGAVLSEQGLPLPVVAPVLLVRLDGAWPLPPLLLLLSLP